VLVGALLHQLRGVAEANVFWVTWNTMLAVVPWVLAVVLFRGERRITPIWLAGAVLFVLFLPNSAYVLTDVIHVPRLVRAEESNAVVVFGILPMFAALFTIGFCAYVGSLRRMRTFVAARGWLRRTWWLPLVVHAASAVGIYVGRVHRLNSWDAWDRPTLVVDRVLYGFTSPLALAGMAITFGVLCVGYLMASALGGVATPAGMWRGADVKNEA
jgi:uncharacterized membrane protein